MKTTLSLVAIYENVEAQESAVAFCDRLIERFWSEFGFDVSWWSFPLLEGTDSAKQAGEKAKNANILLLAGRPDGELPSHVQTWLETWLRNRGDREGTVVGLFGREAAQELESSAKHFYLRRMAHQMGLDYLTQVPQSIFHPSLDSLEAYSERAHQVTGVLDAILHQPPPPPVLR